MTEPTLQQPLDQIQRRPIPMRNAAWSGLAASGLVRLGLKPNHVSVASTGFAAVGGGLFMASAKAGPAAAAVMLVGAAICIAGRLICNMLDGMMAVECNQRSKTGELFNEIPDRLSDTIFFAAAGYSLQASLSTSLNTLSIGLGWGCAALALLTAYIRAFGARYTPTQDYCGPMAKPQRMFALAVGALLTAIQVNISGSRSAMLFTLAAIATGSIITCLRRTNHLAMAMTAAPEPGSH